MPKSNRCADKTIPSRPTLFFRGHPQSKEFVAGAFAMRDVLASISNVKPLGIGTAYDELKLAARFAKQFLDLLGGGSDTQLGAAATLAHWLVIAKSGGLVDPEEWTPLECEPVYSVVADRDHWDPPANSAFFAVHGKPVSVGPELIAYAWIGSEWEHTPLELVRMLGKAITKSRFDAMRQELAEAN